MDKKVLRKEMKDRRNALNKEKKSIYDLDLLQQLLDSKYYIKSRVIFIYLGFGSEIDTSNFIKKFISDGKTVCIPRTNIEEKYMDAVIVHSLDDLELSKYGILEPSKELRAINKELIDLVIVPGLAFDNKGGRIGYGGGYYDKYLDTISNKARKVALAYDFQIIEDIPMESHDIRVDDLFINRKR